MDTDSASECVREDGIYTNETCHYYEVLKRLCLQIGLEQDDAGNVQSAYYAKGCFAGGDSQFFVNAQSGADYDFEKQTSLEIRSTEDPYMVFAYARDNLGTDFTIFLYMALFATVVGLIALLKTCF